MVFAWGFSTSETKYLLHSYLLWIIIFYLVVYTDIYKFYCNCNIDYSGLISFATIISFGFHAWNKAGFWLQLWHNGQHWPKFMSCAETQNRIIKYLHGEHQRVVKEIHENRGLSVIKEHLFPLPIVQQWCNSFKQNIR